MNISSLLSGTASNLTGSSATASQATTASSSVSPFLAQAEQRIQTDADVTTAQISKFGAVKSALSDGQAAALAMTVLSSSTTATDATTALGNFFNKFNTAISAANAASTASASDSQTGSAKRLVQDLKSALSSDPAISDDMAKLGLTVQSDGSLVQDPKKFANALATDPSGTLAAMAKIGGKVDSVITNELGSSGTLGAALSTLNARSATLTTEQAALQALNQSMAAMSAADPFFATDNSSQNSATSSLSGSGLAAYQSNMTGY